MCIHDVMHIYDMSTMMSTPCVAYVWSSIIISVMEALEDNITTEYSSLYEKQRASHPCTKNVGTHCNGNYLYSIKG